MQETDLVSVLIRYRTRTNDPVEHTMKMRREIVEYIKRAVADGGKCVQFSEISGQVLFTIGETLPVRF